MKTAERQMLRPGPAHRHLFLVGFSGSGKSTIGPLLARLTRCSFCDLDTGIARAAGMSISDIFGKMGEKSFRALEKGLLTLELKRRTRPTVLALGGGAFQDREIRQITQQAGVSIYLSCSKAELFRRLKDKTDRPLLQVRPRSGQTLRQARIARIGRLLESRKANYLRADLTVSTTSLTPEEAAAKIAQKVKAMR